MEFITYKDDRVHGEDLLHRKNMYYAMAPVHLVITFTGRLAYARILLPTDTILARIGSI